jgi:hypothetical protein
MGSLIYRYTGEGFSRIYLPSDTLIVDFEMLADGSGWAVGRNGAFLRYELPNKVFLPVAHR